MACTANEMIAFARSFINTKEYPTNSNRTKFGEAYGVNGVPWCCIFQWYLFKKKGMYDQFYDGKKTASCTTLMNWAKSKHKFYTNKYKPGDLVFYNFDKVSDADHIGIITRVSGDYIYAVEGNTSKNGSQDNGGAVLEKQRHKSLILGVYRPTYKTDKAPSSTTPSSTSTSNHAKKKIVANGQKAANKFVGCNIVADGIWGNKTKKAAIKVVQTALNKDYGAKLSVDGIWGSATDKAFGSHYVKVGERQWLVTALEILCALKGKDPKGIEYPGVFGQGLKKACGVSKAVKSTFKNLCS